MVGVGRLVVPAIGLPIVWAQQGDIVPLVVWALLTVAALIAVIVLSVRRIRSGRKTSDRPESATSQVGVRRLRGLAAAMIGLQYLIEPEQFAVDGIPWPTWGVPVITIALLGMVNLTTDRSQRMSARRSGMLGLTVDTIVVVALVTSIGNSGITWILFALPIIEAAIGFGIAGALFHWIILTSVALVSRVWVSEVSGASNSTLITELEQVLDQLSILLLVVIPGAYLAEQLMIDVRSQEKATDAAKDKSSLLETVVEAGHEVNRIGGQHWLSAEPTAAWISIVSGYAVTRAESRRARSR